MTKHETGDYMYINSLNQNDLNFKDLERNIYKVVCETACEILKDTLNQLDKMIMATRDVDEYRHKGLKKTHIHTIMGVIEYERRIYECYDEDGKKQYKYLLDEYLNNETIGHVSTNLAEKIVERVLEEPYRKTKQAIKSMTNADLSHTTVWNVVQKTGAKLVKKEQNLIKKYEQGDLNGEREVDVLFQEADGVWLSMQGDDRSKKSGKKEMKIAINYEGWKGRKGQKEGYEVYNKTVCAGFHKSNKFKKLWDAKVSQQYNTDEIKMRIVNGDGDPWIKPDLGIEGVHFQLDPFHIAREVLRKVPEKDQAKKLNKLLRKGNIKETFQYLTELLIEYNHDEDKFKKLEKLYNYLSNNQEGLIPYRLRKLNLPSLPDELKYRGMGTMEHNVCDIVTLRMKNRKMSWSKQGANHLVKLLAARASGSLYQELSSIFDRTIPETMLDEFIEKVPLSAAEVNKKTKKTGIYFINRAPMPYEGQARTEGRKAIRNLVENRFVSDLGFN